MFDGGKITEYRQGSDTFYIRPMNPFLALRLLGDLQKLVSPVIGNVFSALDGESPKKKDDEFVSPDDNDSGEVDEKQRKDNNSVLNKKLDMQAVEKAFAALAEHVDGLKLEKMCARILDKDYVSVSIAGREVSRLGEAQINELFTGNISGMLMLIVEVLMVNYGDFTQLFKSLSGKAVALKRTK